MIPWLDVDIYQRMVSDVGEIAWGSTGGSRVVESVLLSSIGFV